MYLPHGKVLKISQIKMYNNFRISYDHILFYKRINLRNNALNTLNLKYQTSLNK